MQIIAASTQVVLLGHGHSRPPIPIARDRRPPSSSMTRLPRRLRRRRRAAREAGVPSTRESPRWSRSTCASRSSTHLHSDHTVGYPDLILTPWTLGRRVPLEVYGPTGIKAMTEHLLEAYRVDYRDAHQRRRHTQWHVSRGPPVNAHDIGAGRRLQGRQRDRDRVRDEARDGELRLSLRHARSQHRHLRRHESDAGDDRCLPRLRRADPRSADAGVAGDATGAFQRFAENTTRRRRSWRNWPSRRSRAC